MKIHTPFFKSNSKFGVCLLYQKKEKYHSQIQKNISQRTQTSLLKIFILLFAINQAVQR